MIATPEKFVALNKANVETSVSVANIWLDGAERLTELHLAAAKAAVADTAKNAKILGTVKDAQGLVGLNSDLVSPSIEKFVSFSRSVYEIAAQTQSELAQVLEERVNDFNKTVVSTLESVAKSAPTGVGADAAVAAVKSAVAAASSAYDTMSKAAKQVADMTEANVTAITSRTVATPKKAKAA
jgi:phasin family protein